jgi:lysophospholipase L1-like esterase
VIELGTNDALRADFAASTSNAAALANRQKGTAGNIKSDVGLARALASCVVLVTPTTYPTKVFGPGTPQTEKLFSQQALRVDELLRQQSSRGPHGVTAIANWAKVSAGHHLSPPDAGNWFSSDELHPNFAGARALASLISRTVGQCPGLEE